jgi:type II secretory ATPase GspE/PulE/Tfp pilus assembly ATPase PilB-like protein
VNNTLAGINNTIMVYGHTGSGKTFTMTGGIGEDGIVQMSVKLLRKKLENQLKFEDYCIKMSYF